MAVAVSVQGNEGPTTHNMQDDHSFISVTIKKQLYSVPCWQNSEHISCTVTHQINYINKRTEANLSGQSV